MTEQAADSGERRRGPGRYLAVEAGLGVLALALAGLADAAVRPALAWGFGCALLSGLLALPAVHLGLARGTSGLLAGFTAGFLARAALVAVGLVASGARGAAALPYVFAFFVLYAVTQGVEIAYVVRHARPPGRNDSK